MYGIMAKIIMGLCRTRRVLTGTSHPIHFSAEYPGVAITTFNLVHRVLNPMFQVIASVLEWEPIPSIVMLQSRRSLGGRSKKSLKSNRRTRIPVSSLRIVQIQGEDQVFESIQERS